MLKVRSLRFVLKKSNARLARGRSCKAVRQVLELNFFGVQIRPDLNSNHNLL
jgi:hypothetical protein